MIAVRTCIGCRRTAPKPDLLRLAWDPATDAVVLDPRQVLPGRGCYLHPECAGLVVKRRVAGRALRRPVDAAQLAAALGVD